MVTKKQLVIERITQMMADIHRAYINEEMFKQPLWVHQSMSGNHCISIDLYHFGGDGHPVCDGLKPCPVAMADGKSEAGDVFCMSYDTNRTPRLVFLYEPIARDAALVETDADTLPEVALQNVAAWLKGQMLECSPFRENKQNDATSLFFYMWNRWCEEECRIVFHDDDYNHFWKKWCGIYDEYGRFGKVEHFYAELSNHNRDKLLARAKKLFDGNSEK